MKIEEFSNIMELSLGGMLDKDSCKKITENLSRYIIQGMDRYEVAESNERFLQMVATGFICNKDVFMTFEYYPRLIKDIAEHMGVSFNEFRDIVHQQNLDLIYFLRAIRDLED